MHRVELARQVCRVAVALAYPLLSEEAALAAGGAQLGVLQPLEGLRLAAVECSAAAV